MIVLGSCMPLIHTFHEVLTEAGALSLGVLCCL